jgi:hypothetical protein
VAAMTFLPSDDLLGEGRIAKFIKGNNNDSPDRKRKFPNKDGQRLANETSPWGLKIMRGCLWYS